MSARNKTTQSASDSPNLTVVPVAQPADDLLNRLTSTIARISIYASAAQTIAVDDGSRAKEAAGWLPRALDEIGTELQDIHDEFERMSWEARS